MTTEFILPDIGEGIVECELLEWLIAEGEHIEEDQPVAEVMTDKATVQIPAMHAGTVKKLHYKVGDIAKVHEPLFAMDKDDDDDSDTSASDAQTDEQPATSDNADNASNAQTSQGHAEDFILPDIGEGIVECEIVKWHVSEGDSIEEDQAVVEVMTDKAVVEIPAKNAGTVHKLYYQEGDIAQVHEPLFALMGEGSGSADNAMDEAAPEAPVTQTANSNSVSAKSDDKWQDGAYEPPVAIPGRVLASPAVRRVAREKDLDLTNVEGSGKKGRILKQDVTDLAASSQPQTQSQSDQAASQSTSQRIQAGGKRTEKVRGIQAAMAKQMTASVQTIPHFTVSDELQMDALMALRSELKPVFAQKDIKLSFMPFFVKALSLALQDFAVINSQLNDDATELTYFDDHNIGFAVDSKVGLLVPNIKQVQSKSLFDIAREMNTMIDAAREGKLSGDDLKGGTISISNIGALGGTTATPVINKPEAAIVALGKTQKLPRFDDQGGVSAQHFMTVNWSGDHRIIDGATMVKFNNLWMSYLQSPSTMLMHLR
ncbi:dihydrolipoyllysine-residue acetyltransferase [Alteromonas halophila]|uniref:Dihydrolipoamide acetyltransferase component of pyruvate dehydrogenase complex n=1 Tax=Alteromonas halophila TaxID=516698 RepID=A0A918JN12_9ALTE|nr:dihydrolipoyllysine-residue acetyltransferase [Alteromonas halophila]GGW88435.1 dihydrolipoamide acetyltransferase component of pyruvate dehydrogenase complex [Alteromonas halophila]